MGWFMLLLAAVLLVIVVRTTVDRETSRKLKCLGKALAAAVGLIILISVLSFIGH